MPLERLKSRSQFLAVARARRKWVTPGMVLQARAPGQDEMLQRTDLKVGFTVSRKVGGAVTRNRVRRRLKAVAECVMPGKAGAGQDYVVIGRRGAIKRPFELLKQDMEIALRRLGTGRGTRT